MNHLVPVPTGVYTPRPRPSIAGDHTTVQHELDEYGVTVQRFREGRVPEAVFLENRLRYGVYGQRQDGVHMMRSKLPLGLVSPEQLEAFADVAEVYGNGIAHLTTRQDIQTHFVPLERTAEYMKVLDRAEVTSREACGNVVRNVTAGPLGGVERGEAFDPTPYGMVAARFLLRHPDGQSLGRKFKICFAGTWDRRFNLGALHDIGLTAVVRDGRRGFYVEVGGGLGAVPHEAKPLAEFLPVEELLPTMRALLKVFGQYGEKQRRARARMKFLVADWGIDRFREAVFEARAALEPDPSRPETFDEVDPWLDVPLHPPGGALPEPRDDDDALFLRNNVEPQRQDGYVAVNVRVPMGDLTPPQLRALADLLRREAGDTTRIGTDQSLWIRWVSTDRLWSLRDGLRELGLGDARAGGLGDTVTCPGADTCKLGITTPRSLARQMQAELDELAKDPQLERLRVHVSGCPNSCAQHHIGDIGLFGAARTVEGVTAPHFMLLLGGLAGGRSEESEGDGFGTTITKLPSAHIGEAIRRLATAWRDEALPEEPFGRWVRRNGRARFKTMLEDLVAIPSPSAAPEYYVEFGKPNEKFKVVRGTGECAGAVVLAGDLLLMDAARFADEATGLLDAGAEVEVVRAKALAAFDKAARALVVAQGIADVPSLDVVGLFTQHYYDTGAIFEGTGHYYLTAVSEPADAVHGDRLRRLVVEAELFVEEAQALHARLLGTPGMGH